MRNNAYCFFLKQLCGIAHVLGTAAEAIVTQIQLESPSDVLTETAFYLKCIDRALRSGAQQLHVQEQRRRQRHGFGAPTVHNDDKSSGTIS